MSDIRFHTLEESHNNFARSLYNKIANYNAAVASDSKLITLAICANDQNNQMVGAISGWLQWGWLFIDMLWVDESTRKKGIGHQLLYQLEQAALDQGIDRAYLDTSSFQAPVFYQKNGYEIFSEMDVTADNGKNYVKYSMRKKSIQHWRQNHP